MLDAEKRFQFWGHTVHFALKLRWTLIVAAGKLSPHPGCGVVIRSQGFHGDISGGGISQLGAHSRRGFVTARPSGGQAFGAEMVKTQLCDGVAHQSSDATALEAVVNPRTGFNRFGGRKISSTHINGPDHLVVLNHSEVEGPVRRRQLYAVFPTKLRRAICFIEKPAKRVLGDIGAGYV